MRKAGFSCCRGNQITNTGYRLGKRRDAETKIKGGREEENPLENFRAMNCFTTLSSNRTVPSAKLSSAVLVSTRYLPPTQFVILGDLCFSKQEEIFRDREEKKIKHTPHHLISVIVLRCLYEEMCSEEVRVLTRQVRMPNWPLKTLLNNNNNKKCERVCECITPLASTPYLRDKSNLDFPSGRTKAKPYVYSEHSQLILDACAKHKSHG